MPSIAKFDIWQNSAGVNQNTIIQVQHTRYDPNTDTYTTVSGNTVALSDFTMTFTPKYPTSKLYISSRMHVRIVNATGCWFGITRDGVDLDGMGYLGWTKDFYYKGDSVNHHYTGHCEAFIDAVSTTPSVFRLKARGADNTWEISYGHGEHCMTIMEIAQ
jgi:hypothetical protein